MNASDTHTKNRHHIIVGVMRGGPSSEYDVSLKTGGNVMNALRDRYQVRDIFVDKNGRWHIDGVARPAERILPHVDVVFNALHGEWGEDGRVQQILEAHNKPYTGSGSFASALGMNKWLSKKFFRDAKLKVPEAVLMDINALDHLSHMEAYKKLDSLLHDFHGVAVVKPVAAGSSVGVSVVRDVRHLKQALDEAHTFGSQALIEKYIFGKEGTVGVVAGSHGDTLYALPPISIKNKSSNKDFFGYDAKYQDDLHELVCPGEFTTEERIALEDAATRAHKALGLRHYSRSDFIITPNGVYILETNSLPGLTSSSLIPRALAASGVSFHDFLDHVIDLALRR